MEVFPECLCSLKASQQCMSEVLFLALSNRYFCHSLNPLCCPENIAFEGSHARIFLSDQVSTFQDSIQSRRRSLAPSWQQPSEQLIYGEIPHSSSFSTSAYIGGQYEYVNAPRRFSNVQPRDQVPTEKNEYIHRPIQHNDQISSFQDTIRMYPSRLTAERDSARTTQVYLSEPRYVHEPDHRRSSQTYPTNPAFSAYQTSGYPTQHPTYLSSQVSSYSTQPAYPIHSAQSPSTASYTTVVQARPAYDPTRGMSGVLGGRVLSYPPAQISPPAPAAVYRTSPQWAAGATYDGDSDPSGSVVCC